LKNIPWATSLRWLGTLLAVALLIWLVTKEGWGDILVAFQQAALWRLGLVVLLTLISRLAVAGRWHALLRGAGVQTTYIQTARITFAGLFASNFLPTTIGGDVVRLGGAIRMGYDRAIVLASLVVDRLVGMTGMALAAPLALLGIPASAFYQGMMSALPGLVLAGAWHNHPWILKLRTALRSLSEALARWIRRPMSLLSALFFTFIHMLCTFSSVALFLAGMNQAVSFWLIGGLWSVGYFITLLPISVNGMGTQELAITFLYTRYAGISTDSALALALLMRVMPMLASLPGVLFVPEIIAGNQKKAK
jgi:uncharacterized membrane protein YbhN (UPF0104 family)